MRRSVFVFGLSVILLALGVAAVTLFLTRGGAPDTTASSTSTIGGPFALLDTSGKTVTDQAYRGKWLLIYFGYTSCPDACPTALNNISVALKKLGPDAAKLAALFVTVDPKRDTVRVMADYLKSFDPRIVGLTGSQGQTDAIVKEYRVYVAPVNGSDGLIDHTAAFYVVDPEGHFVNVISGDASGDNIAARFREAFGG